MSFTIRPASESDGEAIWAIFHAVVAAGDTYTFAPDTPREEALAYWFQRRARIFVAESASRILGFYQLKPNQVGLGDHVANAGFMVASAARGQGVGRALAAHCLAEARAAEFRAMQFNFVVSTNTSAVALWQDLGFEIIGTLPGVFRHRERGFVDAYVMFRSLLD